MRSSQGAPLGDFRVKRRSSLRCDPAGRPSGVPHKNGFWRRRPGLERSTGNELHFAGGRRLVALSALASCFHGPAPSGGPRAPRPGRTSQRTQGPFAVVHGAESSPTASSPASPSCSRAGASVEMADDQERPRHVDQDEDRPGREGLWRWVGTRGSLFSPRSTSPAATTSRSWCPPTCARSTARRSASRTSSSSPPTARARPGVLDHGRVRGDGAVAPGEARVPRAGDQDVDPAAVAAATTLHVSRRRTATGRDDEGRRRARSRRQGAPRAGEMARRPQAREATTGQSAGRAHDRQVAEGHGRPEGDGEPFTRTMHAPARCASSISTVPASETRGRCRQGATKVVLPNWSRPPSSRPIRKADRLPPRPRPSPQSAW